MNKAGFLLGEAGVIVLMASGAGSLAAHPRPQANGVPIHMVVTEEVRQGSNLPRISQNDVAVLEGHEHDTPTAWVAAQGNNAAMEFFILLDDDSTSVTLGTQLADIRQFILAQPSSTKVGVAYMRNGIAWIAQQPTSDHTLATKALRLPYGMASANGSPYFSLTDLVKRWPKSDSRREVLMISDGYDRYYGQNDLLDPYLIAAIHDAQRAGIVVSTIYNPGVGTYRRSFFSTYWGQVYLAQVADRTGGQAYYIGFNGPAVAFAPFLNDLSNRLNHLQRCSAEQTAASAARVNSIASLFAPVSKRRRAHWLRRSPHEESLSTCMRPSNGRVPFWVIHRTRASRRST